MPVIIQCAYCGDDTEKWPAEVERRENNYCSQECSANAQVDGDPEETHYCDVCGDEINRSPSQIDRYDGGKFCGEGCVSESRRDKSNPTEVRCAGCDNIYTIPEARVGFDNFCSEECEEEHGLDCPQCDETGFKSMNGVKMHYTRVHGERFDKARLEDEYVVPLNWLLRTLHHTLQMPIYTMATELNVGRDWIKERLGEMDCGRREGIQVPISDVDVLHPDEDFHVNHALVSAIRYALGERSWP